MIIKKQDIFDTASQFDAICVTTNGVITKTQALVMGAGVAKQFKLKYPGIEYELGKKVRCYGNIPFLIYKKKQAIVSFPTKHNWKDKSDLDLIEASAKALVKLATSRFWTKVALPAPGVGKGGLSWKKEVEPLLINILDDRFVILFK
jgi:hypothetical protein